MGEFEEKVVFMNDDIRKGNMETKGMARRALKQQNWKRYLKYGVCCGAPILALVVLAGGGGAELGAAQGLLPIAAAVACPLVMYFMMRSMSHVDQHKNPGDKEQPEKDE